LALCQASFEGLGFVTFFCYSGKSKIRYGESDGNFMSVLNQLQLCFVVAIRSNYGVWIPKGQSIRYNKWQKFNRVFSNGIFNLIKPWLKVFSTPQLFTGFSYLISLMNTLHNHLLLSLWADLFAFSFA
jgi:hypothetical protein